MGVDCLKIEGRMRSPEYVAQSVMIYRHAIDGMPIENGRELLKEVFNRGDYCSAYMTKDAAFNVVYPQTQSNIGKFIGKIDKISQQTTFCQKLCSR